ncbi:hypothetical protein [Streptomyces acidicola]|uniref:Uncharacterized protein n=1 Tax=Streptomyces acidicola TaxID=2596892 RepID=A0A5N8WTN3_9ACTN|nr:hypothetical protein [Streptomyces acidicola]MPY50617.1 hypothetical protein [Streptomyces acidicola]
MTDHRQGGPGANGEPVPRDMPDQQAHGGDDPWDVVPEDGDPNGEATPATDVPDTDEAGSGRRGVPKPGSIHPEQPVPYESTD